MIDIESLLFAQSWQHHENEFRIKARLSCLLNSTVEEIEEALRPHDRIQDIYDDCVAGRRILVDKEFVFCAPFKRFKVAVPSYKVN